LLETSGYSLESESFKERVYVRRGGQLAGSGYLEDPEGPRPVEVHPVLHERFLGRVIDITEAFTHGLRVGAVAGVPARIPGPAALALHLFAHAAPAAVGRGLRLIQLYDLRFLPDDAEIADALISFFGPAAWGLGALFSRSLPGCLPPGLLSSLERAAPSGRRRRAWLARPGLMTGDEEKTILVLHELGLCESPAAVLRRVRDAFPERSVLRNLYGLESGPLVAFGRYYRDRFS
jgi:hypothetical protein